MTPPRKGLLGLACLFASLRVAIAASGFESVHISSAESDQTGNGVRFSIRGGCATVTASHILADTPTPVIAPMGTGQPSVRIVVDNLKADIAILHQTHTNTSDCLTPPDAQSLLAALRGTTREVWTVSSSGGARIFKVDLIEISEETLTLKLLDPNPSDGVDETFSPGMSGSAVVFDGTPVGYLKHVPTEKGGFAIAVRLDHVFARYREHFPQPVVTQPMRMEGFDISKFPADIKEVVKEARARKKRVVRMMKEALAVKQKAEDAAARAQLLPKNVVMGGLAHFDADNGNQYSGEVFEVGSLKGSNGFGVATVGDGDNVGDKRYCRWIRDKGCRGLGFIEYGDNPGNNNELEKWIGNMEGDRRGEGYLSWHSGEEAWYFHGDPTAKPGVWVSDDGRVFEGEILGRWHGKGSLWNKDGSLILIGVWKDGEVQTDRTSEVR